MTPDLWRGPGSATYLLTQPWIILGQDPTTAVRLAFVLAFLICGCAIYAWLRPVFGDLAGGLAGLVYMLQPIFLTTVYVHGNLGGALALAWLPLALAGLAGSARHRPLEGAAVAVLAIIALWRTEAGLAVPATLLLLAYAVLVERHWAPTLAVLTAAGAALVTLLPVWTLTAPSPVAFADHFVTLALLLDVRSAVPFTEATAASTAGTQNSFAFGLGFAPLAFSALTLWLWLAAARGADPRRSPLPAPTTLPTQAPPPTSLHSAPLLTAHATRLLAFAFGGSFLLVLLSLGLSAPLWQITGAHRLLTYPWEILLLAAPLLAVTAGCLPALLPDFQRAALPALRGPAYWFVLVTLVILGGYPYLAPTYLTVTPPARPVAILGANELAVLAAQVAETDGAAVLDITWQVLAPLQSDDNIFFQAIAEDGAANGAAEQVVAQLDAQPLGPDRGATTWQPGEILTARYTLALTSPEPTTAGAPAAPLRYYFGFYNWETGARLPLDGGIDDKLVLYAD
jgi:hypothetical protein